MKNYSILLSISWVIFIVWTFVSDAFSSIQGVYKIEQTIKQDGKIDSSSNSTDFDSVKTNTIGEVQEPKPDSTQNCIVRYRDAQVQAAIINAFALVLVTLLGGFYLKRIQGNWEERRARDRVKYQWKYEIFDSLDKVLVEIQGLAFKFENSWIAITELERRTPDNLPELLRKKSDELEEIRAKLYQLDNELLLLQKKSKFLFKTRVSDTLQIVRDNVTMIHSSPNNLSDEKVRSIKESIVTHVGHAIGQILKELSK